MIDKILYYCKARRDFLKKSAIIAVTAAIALQFWIMIRYLLSPNSREARQKWKVGYPDEFNDGVTFIEKAKIFILRDGNEFKALSSICTHLGCTLKKTQEVYKTASGVISATEFHCPCHGSKFNASGERITGPAREPLQYLQVTISRDDNQLLVDKSAPVDRDYSIDT